MSYSVIATISESATLTRRIKACAAEQQIPNPSYWAEANALLLAASPGWATAWARQTSLLQVTTEQMKPLSLTA